MCGARAAGMARETRRVLLTRVKRESLGIDEAEPGRLTRLFTLHDASPEGHVGAKRLKVNQREAAPALRRASPRGVAAPAGSLAPAAVRASRCLRILPAEVRGKASTKSKRRGTL